MRKVFSWTATDATGRKHTATVYRDTYWGQYVVRLSIDGRHQTRVDYFDNDKTSAMLTAKAMARHSCGPAIVTRI